MSRETRIAMIKNRISLLQERGKDNYNIVKALRRELRKLEG